MKEFQTAVRDLEPQDDDSGLPFTVDGVELRCFKPHEGQVILLMSSFGRHASQNDKIAGIIDFFVQTLDEQSHQHLVGRLLDRDDPFGIEEVESIMEWMIEEWTGRPTQRSSGSARSQRNGGPKSTQRTSA